MKTLFAVMNELAEAQTTPPGWTARHPRIMGALLLLVLHVTLLPLGGGYLGTKPEAGVLLIGVAQLFYVVPAFILLMKLGRNEMARGMLFAALATFMVNAAGCGMFLWQLSKIDG